MAAVSLQIQTHGLDSFKENNSQTPRSYSEFFFKDFELMCFGVDATRPRLAGDAVLRWWRELVILDEAAFIEDVSWELFEIGCFVALDETFGNDWLEVTATVEGALTRSTLGAVFPGDPKVDFCKVFADGGCFLTPLSKSFFWFFICFVSVLIPLFGHGWLTLFVFCTGSLSIEDWVGLRSSTAGWLELASRDFVITLLSVSTPE